MLLTLDLGGSSTKWRLASTEGNLFEAYGHAPPLSGHIFTPEAGQAFTEALEDMARSLPHAPDSLVAGVTGLSEGSVPWFEEQFAAVFSVLRGNVVVVNDLALAYAAVFPERNGVLVYAGTGSIGVGYTQQGQYVRAGGYGYLIDDAGGAYWQGREGLKSVLHELEEGLPATALTHEMQAALGTLDWAELRTHVYVGGRSTLARLAPAVDRAASQGDEQAQAIQREAGEALARLARILLRQCGTRRLCLSGGALNAAVERHCLHTLEQARVDFLLVPRRNPLLGGEHLLSKAVLP